MPEATALLLSGGGTNWTFAIILYAVIILGGYFLLIRPQRKEKKRVTAMYNEMEVGDTVITTSGFYGVLIDITEEDVIVEFGNNKNCRIPMRKSAISRIEKADDAFLTTDKDKDKEKDKEKEKK